MQWCALDSIHHPTFNTTPTCTSFHVPKYALKYTPACTQLYTASLHRCTLPSTPPSMFSSTLPTMLSRTFTIALNGTHFKMPHCHNVDNCSVRYCRTGRYMHLGESRSRTQIVKQNLLPTLHRLWWYVCIVGLWLKVIVMVLMVMVMVTVTVLKALSQVHWLSQRQCQSFNRVKAFYWPKLPQTQSSMGPKILVETLLLPKHGALKRGS